MKLLKIRIKKQHLDHEYYKLRNKQLYHLKWKKKFNQNIIHILKKLIYKGKHKYIRKNKTINKQIKELLSVIIIIFKIPGDIIVDKLCAKKSI